jgi:hypothetical protein
MSRLMSWMPVAALGFALLGGVSVAHAQQAGAIDPSMYNTGGPGATNSTRPTLVLPETVPASVAENHFNPNNGWSSAGGPYMGPNGQALATNSQPGTAPVPRYAGR